MIALGMIYPRQTACAWVKLKQHFTVAKITIHFCQCPRLSTFTFVDLEGSNIGAYTLAAKQRTHTKLSIIHKTLAAGLVSSEGLAR